MTTHLVIADQETLEGITSANGTWSPLARCVADGEDLDAQGAGDYTHIVTGDRWLFRTPEDAREAMYRKGDPLRSLPKPLHVYAEGPSKCHRVTPLLVSWNRVLPLIAACDLLGVPPTWAGHT